MTYFRGLSLTNVILLALSVAILLTIYAYFSKEPTIKSQEAKLSLAQRFQLYVLRFMHYWIVFFVWLYPCVAELRFTTDVAFFMVFLILEMHRRYFGECVLSILDKKMLDPSYKSGSNPKYEPFAFLVGITPELNNKFCGLSFTLLMMRLIYGGVLRI